MKRKPPSASRRHEIGGKCMEEPKKVFVKLESVEQPEPKKVFVKLESVEEEPRRITLHFEQPKKEQMSLKILKEKE